MISNPFSKLKKKLSVFLQNARGTFFCFLPNKPRGIVSILLRKAFSSIRIGKEQVDVLKFIPENAIIIFTTKYKSKFEFLFANSRHRELGLPVPRLAFDYNIYLFQPISKLFKVFISYIDHILRTHTIPNPYDTHKYEEELKNSGCGFLSLVEKKGFYLRFVKKRMDPLHYIIEIQKKTTRPIFIVPQLMFFDRNPIPSEPSILDMIFGNSQRPGDLRKLATLVRSPGKVFVELSKPLNLKHWISQPTNLVKQTQHQALALALRRQLLLQHNQHHQMITGPMLKSREEVKEAILTSQRVRTFMIDYSRYRQIPLKTVSKKANSYVNEIAASYSPGSIKMMSYIINWIMNSAFDGAVVDKEGLNKIKQIAQQGPLLLVPCHKSHIDYLVLSYVLYHNNMPCPHVAAGKNLSFWPLGTIFRNGGAFFIRRSFRGQELYTKVLSEYVRKLLEEGFNIEMFIEGGRSRTGKLLTPKLGFISMLLEAFKNGACENMFFVPVYIGYDRIIEELAYIHEIEGGTKSPENFSQIIKARKFLKKRYGKIYINFHDPISVKDLISNLQTKSYEISLPENFDICQEVGRRIITAIDKETVITPHGLTAAAILNLSQTRFTCKKIIDITNTYLSFAISQSAKIADTLLLSPDKALTNAFEEYKSRKLIEEVSHDKDNVLKEVYYSVKNNKRSLLDFYKNNCITHFVHPSIVALAILEKDAFQFCASDLHEHHKVLTNLFKYEFAVDLERPSESFVRKTIKAFIDDAILMPHKTIPDTYNITSSGYQKLKLYSTFLKPYFESYIVVFQFIRRPDKEITSTNIKNKVKKIQARGLQMYKRGEIDLVESISKNNYLNGAKLFYELKKDKYNAENNVNKTNNVITKQLKLINK